MQDEFRIYLKLTKWETTLWFARTRQMKIKGKNGPQVKIQRVKGKSNFDFDLEYFI